MTANLSSWCSCLHVEILETCVCMYVCMTANLSSWCSCLRVVISETYVYMYVCMCACMFTKDWQSLAWWQFLGGDLGHTHTHTYIFTHTNRYSLHGPTSLPVYDFDLAVPPYSGIYIYTYTYTYIYTHTPYTYTCTHSHGLPWGRPASLSSLWTTLPLQGLSLPKTVRGVRPTVWSR
jgi:hypothetical protein